MQKRESDYFVLRTADFVLKPIADLKEKLCQITIWARSFGTVLAIEMENAFRFLMRSIGYREEDILEAGKQIWVLSISNLADLERPRLFTTFSVTGYNDRQALKYIPDLPTLTHGFYRPGTGLSQNFISKTHNATLVDVPEKFIEISTGRIIRDPKRHYTPKYIAFKKGLPDDPLVNNATPVFMYIPLELMLLRDTSFDVVEQNIWSLNIDLANPKI